MWRGNRYSMRNCTDEEYFTLVLSATNLAIAILKKHGISCAVVGSLACKLYTSDFRYPKDVDLLVFQPITLSTNTPIRTSEEIKALLVKGDPEHFYLRMPRDIFAPYRILYYRKSYLGTWCKVDILIPGIMNLPNIPPPLTALRSTRSTNDIRAPRGTRNHLTTVSGIPLVPFSLLLLLKLQAWADHRVAPELFKREKQFQDASDVQHLLQTEGLMKELRRTQPWSDTELFSKEFQQLTKERVKRYCNEYPRRAALWQRLGFKTV